MGRYGEVYLLVEGAEREVAAARAPAEGLDPEGVLIGAVAVQAGAVHGVEEHLARVRLRLRVRVRVSQNIDHE